MKVLFWMVALPVILVAAYFAVANRQLVEIDLWPVAERISLPLFAALAAALYAGFVLGALAAWLHGGRARARARAERRRADELARELHRLRELPPATPPGARLPGPAGTPATLAPP